MRWKRSFVMADVPAHACIFRDVYAHNILVSTEGKAVLCDFGASFVYASHQRSFFEAMEIRAFGLFLQDLSAQVRSEGGKICLPGEAQKFQGKQDGPAQQDILEVLRSVSKWCLCTIPGARPSFTEVVSALEVRLYI